MRTSRIHSCPCLRINRIRLEFKEYGKVQVGEVTMSVLIESDWNLKRIVADLRQKIHTVLIESDWNLKDLSAFY